MSDLSAGHTIYGTRWVKTEVDHLQCGGGGEERNSTVRTRPILCKSGLFQMNALPPLLFGLASHPLSGGILGPPLHRGTTVTHIKGM